MRKRQLPFPEDISDPRNNLQPDTEVVVWNQQGGADAIDTACISKIGIGTPVFIQGRNSWERKASNILRAGAGLTWKHFS